MKKLLSLLVFATFAFSLIHCRELEESSAIPTDHQTMNPNNRILF